MNCPCPIAEFWVKKQMKDFINMYLEIYKKDDYIEYCGDFPENDASFEGKTEQYINDLEFKEGEELDIDEEWYKFCEIFFNDWWDAGKSFFNDVEENTSFSEEFNSAELMMLLKEYTKHLEDTGMLQNAGLNLFLCEEHTWNTIAYFWIKEKSEDIKEFIMEKIQEQYEDYFEKDDDVNNRLTCDICYQNKKIKCYTACCFDKKLCGSCFKRTQKKECPFCRGNMKLGDLIAIENRQPFGLLEEIRNRSSINQL